MTAAELETLHQAIDVLYRQDESCGQHAALYGLCKLVAMHYQGAGRKTQASLWSRRAVAHRKDLTRLETTA